MSGSNAFVLIKLMATCILTASRFKSVGAVVFPRSDSLPSHTHRSYRLKEIGVITGYGYGVNAASLPEGTYSPVYFKGNFGYGFQKADKINSSKAHFELLLQPQVNIALLRSTLHTSLHTELGLGVGLQEMFALTRSVFPYIQIVAGPHFFSTITAEQHRGFVFSDHVAAGFYWFPWPKYALQTGYMARHLSNGNLALPNHGINTYNFIFGVSRFFK